MAALNENGKKPWWQLWREALIAGLVVALFVEGGCRVFERKTVWHRLDALEEQAREAKHEKELEELRVTQQIDETRKDVDEVKEEVKTVQKKKH